MNREEKLSTFRTDKVVYLFEEDPDDEEFEEHQGMEVEQEKLMVGIRKDKKSYLKGKKKIP